MDQRLLIGGQRFSGRSAWLTNMERNQASQTPEVRKYNSVAEPLIPIYKARQDKSKDSPEYGPRLSKYHPSVAHVKTRYLVIDHVI